MKERDLCGKDKTRWGAGQSDIAEVTCWEIGKAECKMD